MPDWLMVGLTFLGILVTAAIAWLAYRANVRAAEAQREAAAAQAAAVAANDRANRAQIDILKQAVENSNSRPGPTGVVWIIERDETRKHIYLAKNAGNATAYRVVLSGLTEEDQADIGLLQDVSDLPIQPGGSFPFVIERTLASPPATVVVISWVSSIGDNQEPQESRHVVI